MSYTPIWRQAHTSGLVGRLFSGKNHTIAFDIPVYMDGNAVRLSFLNAFGDKATTVKSVAVLYEGKVYSFTKDKKKHIKVPAGERVYSDDLKLKVKKGTTLNLRICMKDKNADSNMTEEFGLSYRGDVTKKKKLRKKEKPALLVKNGIYYPVPALEAVEIRTKGKNAPKVIAAFGDSITSMSRWTVPLAKRLYDTYGSEFQLVNEGILGNCLTYEKPGAIWSLYGEAGVKRIARDLEGISNLHTVILALGTNDFSYADKKHREQLSAENVIAATEKVAKDLKAKGIRVVGETISPRFGYFGVPKYDDYMNEQRLKFNEWILSTDIFDYVFDACALVADPEKPDWYDDRYHQGDHLHPNAEGGKVLADGFDLVKLTGK